MPSLAGSLSQRAAVRCIKLLRDLTKRTLCSADPGTGAFNFVRILSVRHMRAMFSFLPLRPIFGIMTSASLKKKIKSLVDAEKGTKTLRRIHDLLIDPPLDAGQQDELVARLGRAEEDFKAGRVMGADETHERWRASLKKHRAAQARTAKRV